MLGLNKLGKTANRLVSAFETKVREGQQQLEKLLGDTGVMDHAKISTVSEMSDAYRAMAKDLLLNPWRFVGAEMDLARKHAALGSYTISRYR